MPDEAITMIGLTGDQWMIVLLCGVAGYITGAGFSALVFWLAGKKPN